MRIIYTFYCNSLLLHYIFVHFITFYWHVHYIHVQFITCHYISLHFHYTFITLKYVSLHFIYMFMTFMYSSLHFITFSLHFINIFFTFITFSYIFIERNHAPSNGLFTCPFQAHKCTYMIGPCKCSYGREISKKADLSKTH